MERKRKRSLVQKTSVLLSSSDSEGGPESLDDSEESNFVVDEASLSEIEDVVEELMDSDEEASSGQQAKSKVSLPFALPISFATAGIAIFVLVLTSRIHICNSLSCA